MKIRRIISRAVVLSIVIALSAMLHIAVNAEYQTEEAYITTEVTTTTQIDENAVRRIVRDEYGTYLSTVNISLGILTAFAAIFALIVPITQVIVHERKFKELKGEMKERTEKLDEAIAVSKELQEKVELQQKAIGSNIKAHLELSKAIHLELARIKSDPEEKAFHIKEANYYTELIEKGDQP